jgi:integrase
MSITAEKKHGRPTGRWRVEVGGKDKRLRGRVGSFEEAQRLEKEFRRRLATGEVAQAASTRPQAGMVPVTLLDALEKAQDKLWREGAWKPQAIAHVRVLAALMGAGKALADLTDDDFETAADTLLETKAPATLNKALAAVSKLLEHARAKGWIAAVPKLPWQPEPKGRIRVLTSEEEHRLLELMPKDVQALCILAVETGCRRGELLRVTAQDRTRPNWLVLPKTKAGEPQGVPLTERAQGALADLLADVVPSQQRLRHHFEAARIKAGLEDVCFHTYRHTCATRLLEAGVDLQETKEWLRHSDISTTLRYRHVSSKHLEATAGRLKGLGVSTFFRQGRAA